jgi:hypothetical protein
MSLEGRSPKVADLAREVGVSEATIYTWKSKYGGLEVSEAQRLRQLEEENRRLKHLLAVRGIRQIEPPGSHRACAHRSGSSKRLTIVSLAYTVLVRPPASFHCPQSALAAKPVWGQHSSRGQKQVLAFQ